MLKLETKYEKNCTDLVEMLEGHVYINGAHLSVFTYIIDGVLIDTSSETLLDGFTNWIKDFKVDQVFITHNHEDHTGGAAWIDKNLGIPLYIHPMSVEVCKELEQTPTYRQITWGRRGAFNAQPFSKKMTSQNYNWEIIETPGHTQDHLAFYCVEEKILFSGDLFVLAHTKAILSTENMQDTLASLKKVLTYDFEEVYCCHAGYLKNGRELLEEKIRYLEQLQMESKQLYEQKLPIDEITQKLFPKKYAIEDFSNGEWASTHIIRSLIQDTPTKSS